MITTTDISLDGKSFDVRQTTAFIQTYTENASATSRVTFTDPCKTSAFVTKAVPNQVYFITSQGLASNPFSLPWLDDTTNQLKVTSKTESICYKSTIVITDAGVTPKYLALSPKGNGFEATI